MPTATLEQPIKSESATLPFDVADAADGKIREKDNAVWPKPRIKCPQVTSGEGNTEGSGDNTEEQETNPLAVVLRGDHTEGSKDIIDEIEVSPLVRLSSGESMQRRFTVLQQWEGVVSEVTEDVFWAELRDLTELSNPPEIVEVSREEIAEADQPLLAPGSVFYWHIGYDDTFGGRRRVSEIRVRRTPRWSQHAIDLMNAKAAELLDRFGGHDKDNPTTD